MDLLSSVLQTPKKVGKTKVILLHGTGGSPESNWLPWLAKRLATRGYGCAVPALPTPHAQSLKAWFSTFDSEKLVLHESTVLVGHSIGAGFALRLLERHQGIIAGCFLVSGWEGLLNNPNFDPFIETFFRDPFDYQNIRARSRVIRLYHGADDPYVPLELGQELATNLQSPLQVIPNGGHLNAEAGYLKFPSLLEDILSVLGAEQSDENS